MSKLTEKDFNGVHDPDESGVALWIGKTATINCSVELSVTGIIDMQSESLTVTLSEDDARELANSILSHLNN